MGIEEQKMHPKDPPKEKMYCLFWGMECPVREGIARGSVVDKFAPVEVGNNIKVQGSIPPDMLKLIVLAPYCTICPYKKEKDLMHFKKLSEEKLI